MSKLESQVISKDDLSEKMRDEIGEMRSEMGQVIGKIDCQQALEYYGLAGSAMAPSRLGSVASHHA